MHYREADQVGVRPVALDPPVSQPVGALVLAHIPDFAAVRRHPAVAVSIGEGLGHFVAQRRCEDVSHKLKGEARR